MASDREPTTHSDDVAVDNFASAMKAKLAEARAKGRSGWEICPELDLTEMLLRHVEKGDMRDVANLAMMIHMNRSRQEQAEAYEAYIRECATTEMDAKAAT